MSILEHIDAGRIDLLELGIYSCLSLKATGAGVVETSATSLHALCPQVSSRTLQRRLGHLEQLGLIKTSKTPGRAGLYSVLICQSPIRDSVRDAHVVTSEAATSSHNRADGRGGERDSDVSVSRPAAGCTENIDDDERHHHRHDPPISRNGLEELSITNLPDRNADFVALVATNQPLEGEDLVAWCRRMTDLCNERSVFLPRHFFACARAAAA